MYNLSRIIRKAKGQHMEGETLKNLHLQGPNDLTPGPILNQFEIETIEEALLRYGKVLELDKFKEREAVASSLNKINLTRGKGCCDAIKLIPM